MTELISTELINQVRELNIAKGWRSGPGAEGPTEGPWFPAYLSLIHSEVTEALEAYRDKVWSSTRKVLAGNGHISEVDKPVGVGPELADVIIRVVDTADIWDIDLNREISRVLTYGWTRPYQHGGRTF